MTPAQQMTLEWLANGPTGASSETMAFWLAFDVRKAEADHPWDPGDLNRCLQLLALVPDMRPHLPRMAELSPQWSRLVARWDELESTFIEEAGLGWTKRRKARKTYDLMKELLGG